MSDIYVVAIIVVACSAVIYMGLKGKLELILNNITNNKIAQAAAPVAQAAVQAAAPVVQSVVPYAGAPQVTVSGPAGNGDEIAAVAMAAIQAYESEMGGMSQMTPVFAAGSPADAMAPTLKVQRPRRRESLWVSTARYESHKSL
ncbi:hypothetical protein LJB89_02430 [Tyzzerella sp. OttesenSCG-928-J15]|nr:hypothetical protein [Tyzzerella sp. OttesenSCG-928-J15]